MLLFPFIFQPPWSSTLRTQPYLYFSSYNCTRQLLWDIVSLLLACLQLSYVVILPQLLVKWAGGGEWSQTLSWHFFFFFLGWMRSLCDFQTKDEGLLFTVRIGPLKQAYRICSSDSGFLSPSGQMLPFHVSASHSFKIRALSVAHLIDPS